MILTSGSVEGTMSRGSGIFCTALANSLFKGSTESAILLSSTFFPKFEKSSFEFPLNIKKNLQPFDYVADRGADQLHPSFPTSQSENRMRKMTRTRASTRRPPQKLENPAARGDRVRCGDPKFWWTERQGSCSPAGARAESGIVWSRGLRVVAPHQHFKMRNDHQG